MRRTTPSRQPRRGAVAWLPTFVALLVATLTHIARAEAPAIGAELIRNGGFEEPFDAKGVSPHWGDNSAWAPVEVRHAAETAAPRAGKQAQRIECAAFKGGAVQFVQYAVPLEKGGVYRVSVWMRGEVDAPVEVLLRKTGAPYTTYAGQQFRVGDEWKEFAFDGAAPEDDGAAMLVIRFAAAGTLVIDDASCRRVGTESLAITLAPPAEPIPPAYFGMHIHMDPHNKAFRWPSVAYGSLRLWDAYVSWPHLEPKRGQWNFAKLDRYLDHAKEHNIEVLLPLGLSPHWASARPEEKSAYGDKPEWGLGWAAEPRDLADWDNYVRAVVTHCKGRVKQYEVWNEPNMHAFFSGTPDQLAELVRRAAAIIKEIDPEAELVAPSLVGDPAYLDNLITKGGVAPAQVVGHHFYTWPDPPEKMLPQVSRIRAVLERHKLADRPIWNTEAGWTIESRVQPPPIEAYNGRTPLPMDKASAYITRALILNWAAGVRRYYFYAWDDGIMGLVERDGTPKPPANAYATVRSWLVGARMMSCAADEHGTWTAHLARDAERFVIVWNPAKTMELNPPKEWGVSRYIDLMSTTHPVTVGQPVPITEWPAMLVLGDSN